MVFMVSILTRPTSEDDSIVLPDLSGVPHRSTRRPGVALRNIYQRLLSEGGATFIIIVCAYIVVAYFLDFKYDTFSGDAFSRMANGFYVVYSGDPHLAAIGFVWTPLQSIADLVLLLGNHIWPALSHHDMAGSLVSAFAMAGAAHQIRSALREWGISRVPRLVLTAAFALNPMILFYAGNGMSEGLYLFTLMIGTRYLLRWIRDGDIRSLAFAAIALGFSYLTRNEAFGAAVLGACAVAVITYWRSNGGRSSRLRSALADMAIFAIPAFISALGWAVVSKVITGQFFQQFSSIYGNSEQEIFLGHKSFTGRMAYEVHAIGSMAPLILIVVVAAIALAFHARDFRILAPISILGGALAFDALAFLNNSIEDFYRYFIATIPLEVLLVGSLVAAIPRFTQSRSQQSATPPSSPKVSAGLLGSLAAVAIVLVTMVPATVTTGSAMFNPNIGSEETASLGFIFHSHLSTADQQRKERYPRIIQLGDYFAGLHLPDGDIVVDNSTGCVPEMLTTISQPKLFAIPNDRDFQRVLADPITFHAHYILEPNPAQTPITAENIAYPALWSGGSAFTKMIHQFPAEGTCPQFRLFHVIHHPNQVT